MQVKVRKAFRSGNIIGMPVKTPDHKKVGEIEEIVVDIETGRMAYAVLSFGGFFGFGAPLAVAIFLSVMATNTMAVYGMVTSVVNMTPSRKLNFLPAALILGGIAIVGSTWLALLDQFTAFLTLIGALFIPVFAIRNDSNNRKSDE